MNYLNYYILYLFMNLRYNDKYITSVIKKVSKEEYSDDEDLDLADIGIAYLGKDIFEAMKWFNLSIELENNSVEIFTDEIDEVIKATKNLKELNIENLEIVLCAYDYAEFYPHKVDEIEKMMINVTEIIKLFVGNDSMSIIIEYIYN